MARINNLQNFLTDVATAIKNKKGSQTAIPAANFDTEISNLPSQGVYQHKQVTVVDNGSVTVLPDTGYDAIDQLDLTVNIPLQQKTYTFTQNTTTTIIPEQGYAGFSQVGLEINVPSSQPNLQDKTVTQNGVYTADSGYDGLDTVTVNVSGGEVPVKLFDTIEHMQADPNPEEGDLAVVYDKERLAPLTPDVTTITNMTLNNTIILTGGPVTGSASMSVYGSNYYLQFRLTPTSLTITDRRGTMENVEYISNDGITYTRTDSGPNDYDFGETLNVMTYDSFIMQFIMIKSYVYDGLFQYELLAETGEIRIRDLSTAVITITNGKTSSFSVPNFLPITYNIKDLQNVMDINDFSTGQFYIDMSNKLKFMTVNRERVIVDASSTIIGIGGLSSYGSVTTYDIDLTTGIATNPTEYPELNFDSYYWYAISDIKSMPFYPGISKSYYMSAILENTSMNSWCEHIDTYLYADRYVYAPSQLTLNSVNQLLPNIIGYGANGIIKGNGNIYNHIDYKRVLQAREIIPNNWSSAISGFSSTKSTISYNHTPADATNVMTLTYDFLGYNNTNYYNTRNATKLSENQYLVGAIINGTLHCLIYTLHNDKCEYTQTNLNIACNSVMHVLIDSHITYFLVKNTTDKLMTLVSLNLQTMEIITITSFAYTENYNKAVISPTIRTIFIESTAGFYKVDFDGNKTWIVSSHTTWAAGNCCSNDYITANSGANAATCKLYDVKNDRWTDISVPSASASFIFTVDDKTYILENNTNVIRIVKDGVVWNTVSKNITTHTGSTQFLNVFDVPPVLNNRVFIGGYVYDLSTNQITTHSLGNVYFPIYYDGKESCFTTYKQFVYNINIQPYETFIGDYMGIEYTENIQRTRGFELWTYYKRFYSFHRRNI